MKITEECGAFCLSGALDIYEADSVRHDLLRLLGNRSELTLNLGGVTGCDAAGAQLLCALHKTAIRDRKTIRLAPINQVVIDCWERLGLSAGLLDSPSNPS